LLSVVSLLFLPLASVAQQPVSHVRVVRLSYVSGTVAVKQPGASDWTKALVNVPVQEGFELSTSADSFAEVEFENGSTARLGELSRLAFDQLALDAQGGKLNRMTFELGYATFHFLPEKQDLYSVKVAGATLNPSGKSLFRTNLEKNHVRVEVFNGSVEVVAPSQTVRLGKDKVLDYDTGGTTIAFNVQQGIAKDSWDKWSNARDSQATMALNDQAFPAQGPRFGWSDLDTYGEWAMMPGFGYGWMPFAPMGWTPFSMGMWNWYPGMGNTWISSEPWGWLPYHYGSWNLSPTFGWFWTPGNFNSWSPALVSWYTGPGWVGWAPYGFRSQNGLTPVTTVSGTAIRTGQIISPEGVGHARLDQATLTQQAPIERGSGAVVAVASFAVPAGGTRTLAPTSILMGGEGSKESALTGGRSNRLMRVRLGTTLGGRYAVGGTVGEFRGDAFKGMERPSRGQGNGQPQLSVMPHGQPAENTSGPERGMARGSGGSGYPSAAAHSSAPPSSSPSPAASGASAGHH
jgi:hypothetical protein